MLSEFSVLIIQFGFSINNEHQELSQKAQSRSQRKRAAGHPSTSAVPGRSRRHGWLCPPVGFKYLPPLPTARAKTRLRTGAASGDATYGPAGKESSKPPQREHQAHKSIFRTTTALRPWSGHDADAQPGTDSVTKESANRCLLRLCSTLLSHTHRFFLKHRFDS